MFNRARIIVALSCAAALCAGFATAVLAAEDEEAVGGQEMVLVELVLLVDTSGSVDASEYTLQRHGYSEAFRSAELTSLIEGQGGIAVTYIEWSDADHQDIRIGWRKLTTGVECRAFADEINALERKVEGNTRMAPAIQFAAEAFATNDYVSLKRVIDISGDGRCQNHDFYEEFEGYVEAYGKPWDDVIEDTRSMVDQINGICITTDEEVESFYRDILPQGPGAFVMQVETFTSFGDAILNKLVREVRQVPGMYD